ncbi:helix-turn-helix domain-containing protein [Kibdelosporangium aridum]|uniref:Helix-turn-helix domain-containing protein n=1 Tax=Kibdelosporangium aridum TaxID=2030 RepID=A0A1W2FWY7_KIBAR|nr:helix-turn-helix transcriptional regulator [Kibdelosporangium aridum]SMD26156.1 Helix-turn-helix domain-containing protein [Kibdelosporangium aridum]
MQRQNVNSRGIGIGLAWHRKAACKTLEQVSRQVGISISSLSRLENGKREPTTEEVAAILAVLGVVGAERDQLLNHARNTSHSSMVVGSKSRTYRAFEADATVITNFELMLVPGLAQTAKYARAVLSALRANGSESEINATVSQRMERKAILTRKRPPQVNFIVTELAIRQLIGGAKVMAEQVRHLIGLADLDNVSIRIIPATVSAHAGLSGQFVILDFDDQPSLVFIEAMTTGLYRDEPEDVVAYRRQVENLEAVALDMAGSVELLRSISYDLDGLVSGLDVAEEQLQR